MTVVDHHNSVAGSGNLREHMGRKDYGVLLAETFDQVADLNDLFGIETDGGLV